MNTTSVVTMIVLGTLLIIAIVSVVTVVITCFSKRKTTNEKIFLGKLANSDCSISQAMEFIKLTNGIEG